MHAEESGEKGRTLLPVIPSKCEADHTLFRMALTVEALGRLRPRLPDAATRERLLQLFREN